MRADVPVERSGIAANGGDSGDGTSHYCQWYHSVRERIECHGWLSCVLFYVDEWALEMALEGLGLGHQSRISSGASYHAHP
jgi:hypothetical protein